MTRNKQDALAKDWPEASQFKKSVRFEFALYVSGIILLLMVVTGYVISRQYVKTITLNVVEKLLVQARAYSGPTGKLIISTDGPDALLLDNVCRKLADDNPDVYWAGITGEEGVFLAHTDIKQVITAARMRPVLANQFRDVLRPNEAFDVEGDTIYISVSVKENAVTVGKLVVAASAMPIKRARAASVATVASITVVMILLGIPVTIFVVRRKLRPISVIADHLKRIDFTDISLDIPLNSKNEFGFLTETIRVMGSKLNIAQQELIDKDRMSRELEIAREIQANILPKDYPWGSEFELAGVYRSAREVGGDYYDFIDLDEDRLGILIADVSGKSLPGMLVMLLTRDIVKRLTRSVRQPANLLSQVNRELLQNIKKGMFVTMFVGILHKRTGRFSFASAGHNPLILITEETGKASLIKTKGFPLGMVASATFQKRMESGELTLSRNDWLILYTDGINEAQNSVGEEFGIDRFTRTIESFKNHSCAQLVRQVVRQHELFVGDAAPYDDMTVLTIKWIGKSADLKTRIPKEVANIGCNE